MSRSKLTCEQHVGVVRDILRDDGGIAVFTDKRDIGCLDVGDRIGQVAFPVYSRTIAVGVLVVLGSTSRQLIGTLLDENTIAGILVATAVSLSNSSRQLCGGRHHSIISSLADGRTIHNGEYYPMLLGVLVARLVLHVVGRQHEGVLLAVFQTTVVEAYRAGAPGGGHVGGGTASHSQGSSSSSGGTFGGLNLLVIGNGDFSAGTNTCCVVGRNGGSDNGSLLVSRNLSLAQHIDVTHLTLGMGGISQSFS